MWSALSFLIDPQGRRRKTIVCPTARRQNNTFSANCSTRAEPAEVMRPMLLPSVTFGIPEIDSVQQVEVLRPEL